MEIECPKCSALYEIDEKVLRGGTPTLKCGNCRYMFRVQSGANLSRETERRWMLKEADSGDVRYFREFSELRDWIVRGEVYPEDALSRTGSKWTALGRITELTPLFERGNEGTNDSVPSETESSSASRREDSGNNRTQLMVDSSGEPAPAHESRSSDDTPKRDERSSHAEEGRDSVGVDSPEGSGGTDWKIGDPLESGEDEGAPTGGEGRGDALEDLESANFRSTGRRYLLLSVVLLFGIAGLFGVSRILGIPWERGGLAQFENLWADGAPPPGLEPAVAESRGLSGRALEVGISEVRRREKQTVGSVLREGRERLATSIGAGQKEVRREIDDREKKRYARRRERQSTRDRNLIQTGQRLLERGDSGRAKDVFQRALQKNSKDPAALTGLGWVHLNEGKNESALEYFEKALRVDSQYGDAYIGLGQASRRVGDEDRATEAYQTYLDRFPDGPQASIAEYQLDRLE